jgi:hypothetical protein
LLNPTRHHFEAPPPTEKIARDFQQAGKKKKGCGENEFLPACSVPKARQGWENISATQPFYKGLGAKQKNFRFLN